VSLNKAFIALGTNVGNWKNNFNQSFIQINRIGKITNFGSVYLSNPSGFKDQNFFYNTAIELITTLSAMKLMEELKIIEKKMHKKKLFANGPRRIDLDIIFYNKMIISNQSLSIPHPRAHLRDFVLFPIYDMSPFFRHPLEKKTIKELINNLEENYILKKVNRQKCSVLIY
jgi:2-amino-4-hydroxy-6-hydroxymethyldihydropteridine diphosphokinase